MRSLFPGYFRLSENEKKEIEGCAILVLDANVLLNLYRSSDDARDSLLSVLRTHRERIWLPHQVAFEFLENRPKVIFEQAKLLEDFKVRITESLDTLESPRSHPSVKTVTLTALREAILTVCQEIEEARQLMERRLSNDDLLNQVVDLTQGRVGSGFPDKELSGIFEQGEIRYKEKIPPGYRDDNKGGDQTFSAQRRRFGDYIVWCEILNHAQKSSCDVIFVTADEKDDWWTKQSGRKLGPRPELVEEFSRKTGKRLIMYTAQHFLETHATVTKEVIEEVGQLGRRPDSPPATDRPIAEAPLDIRPLDAEVARKLDDVTRLRFKYAMVKGEIERLSAQIQMLKSSDSYSYDNLKVVEARLKSLQNRRDDLYQSLSIIDFLGE